MNIIFKVQKSRIFGKFLVLNSHQPDRCFQLSQKSMKQVLTKTMRIKHEDSFKRIDKIPDDFEMIYKCPLHYTLNIGKICALAAIIAMPLTYWIYGEIPEAPYFVGPYSTSSRDVMWMRMGLAATAIILYRFCHLVTLRIYQNQKSYIAILPSLIPRRNIHVHFEANQVRENFGAYSPFRGITYKVNGKTMLIVPDRFRKPIDLYEMLEASDAKKYKNY